MIEGSDADKTSTDHLAATLSSTVVPVLVLLTLLVSFLSSKKIGCGRRFWGSCIKSIRFFFGEWSMGFAWNSRGQMLSSMVVKE